MNNYSSYNTINPNSLNSNTLGQFQNSIKYHYTYPDQARILEPHERKRTNFSNTNNNNTISSTPTAAAFISFNNNNNQLSLKSYESEKYVSIFHISVKNFCFKVKIFRVFC